VLDRALVRKRPRALGLLVSLAGVSGCGPTNVGDFPPGSVLVSVHSPAAVSDGGLALPQGWLKVEEPGWFEASMPAAPRTTFDAVPIEGAILHTKSLSASDGTSVWTWIRYFEVSTLTTMLDADTLARAGRANILAIAGVHFLREEPTRPGGPIFDFACTVDPRSPLDPSGVPMVARVRGYKRAGKSSRITFAIAVWPAESTDETARAFFEAFRILG
jgi:hypothetical protein